MNGVRNYCKIAIFLLYTAALAVIPLSAQPKKDVDTGKKNAHPGLAYTSSLNYPLFPHEPGLNTRIAALAYELYTNQLKDALEMSAAISEESGVMNRENIVGYDTVYEDDSVISFLLNGYLYTGGAHGLTTLVPVTYSKKTQKLLTLKEVFTDAPENWLERISEESRRQLEAALKKGTLASNTEWITTGTEPTAENFTVFVVEKDIVRIIFAQYQVAPYSSGMPEVQIPTHFFKK